MGAGVKDIWVLMPRMTLSEGVEVGLLVGRPGTKECAGREQVRVAEYACGCPGVARIHTCFRALFKSGHKAHSPQRT